jgi:hypothetical protein
MLFSYTEVINRSLSLHIGLYESIVSLLFSLLEERVTRLHGQLQRHQQQLLASPGSSSIDNKMLDDLYEDIHWLILVTGWLFLFKT